MINSFKFRSVFRPYEGLRAYAYNTNARTHAQLSFWLKHLIEKQCKWFVIHIVWMHQHIIHSNWINQWIEIPVLFRALTEQWWLRDYYLENGGCVHIFFFEKKRVILKMCVSDFASCVLSIICFKCLLHDYVMNFFFKIDKFIDLKIFMTCLQWVHIFVRGLSCHFILFFLVFWLYSCWFQSKQIKI